MPNNVENRLRISGPEAELERISRLMKSKESVFDFNKIIPMPGVFRGVHTGGCTIDGVSVEIWREVDGKNVIIPPATLARWREKYGANNWYDWAIQNWGTKWNAYTVSESHGDGYLEYFFVTAWASPEIVIDALKAEFPKLRFRVDVDGEIDEPYCYTR